jgi:hypothetical protein
VSVRTRFTITVVTIVAVTVALFATLSIVALDRTLRSGLDARLHSDAQTIATAVDVHQGRISLDPSDLRALGSLQTDTPFAVEDRDGKQIAGDAIPAAQRAAGLQFSSVSVKRGDRTFGTVTVWQSGSWIGDFDRNAAIVSIAVGALLIALGVVGAPRAASLGASSRRPARSHPSPSASKVTTSRAACTPTATTSSADCALLSTACSTGCNPHSRASAASSPMHRTSCARLSPFCVPKRSSRYGANAPPTNTATR